MLPEIIPNWHPIFIHFTIALFSVATVLIMSSLFIKNEVGEKILNCGYFNLWLGCLFTIIAVAAGFHAFYTVLHDEPAHMAMVTHRNWALITAFSFLILTLWSIKLYRDHKKQNLVFIGCLLMATLLLAVTAWKGAEVVYRHGVGVMSLPNPDVHQHER
jgi:uncharacterized membrane protein